MNLKHAIDDFMDESL
jgi:hypothetical protein